MKARLELVDPGDGIHPGDVYELEAVHIEIRGSWVYAWIRNVVRIYPAHLVREIELDIDPTAMFWPELVDPAETAREARRALDDWEQRKKGAGLHDRA